MNEISYIFSSIINPPYSEPSDENLSHSADIISKVYPNDICAKTLKEELRIFYKVHKE